MIFLRYEIKRGRRDHARHDHALVERIHDLAALASLDEEGADDGGDDGDGAEHQGIQHRGRSEEQAAEQHGRDQRDRVGLEQIRRHAGAVADVVADVVRDHRGIARIVLGDARLDLADEIGADVSTLGEDTAAQAREDRDQGTAEGESDEGPQRILGIAEQAAHDEVVAGHPENAETDHQHAGDGAAAEGDLKGGIDAVVGRLRGAHVCPHGDVHADVAGEPGQDRAHRETARGRPIEEHTEHDEQDHAHDRDGGVLPVQIGPRPRLNGGGDFLHPRVTGGLLQYPLHGEGAVEDRENAGTDSQKEGVIKGH